MKLLGCLALLITLVSVNVLHAKTQLDEDLKDTPKYYRDRVQKFRNLLRKESHKEAKIDRALAMAQDSKSPYRKDALNFLAEIRSERAEPLLRKLSFDAEVQEFAIYALGQIGSPHSIDTLIKHLMDPSENVRGISENALKKLTGVDFSYRYFDPTPKRKEGIKEIQNWWKKNEKTFTPRNLNAEESQEADKAWEQYGVQYLHDLSR